MYAYSGIGSRQTPPEVMKVMTRLGKSLQEKYTLRSGHAQGADIAFENGCINGNMEIYIPWKGFAGSTSTYFEQTSESMVIASQYHPAWKSLKDSVKKLMARNVHQVLGPDLKTPAQFVLCWTPDGCETHATRSQKTGGTGQAISIASENNVPVINMCNMFWEQRLIDLLEEYE